MLPSAIEQDANVSGLQIKLTNAATKLREIQDSLRPIVSQCGKDVIDKLEMAMNKLYKLAVFIRGDYDDREPDTAQRDELLRHAVQSFKEVENCAEVGLTKVSQLHAQVMEIEYGVIIPAKKDIALLLQKNQNEVIFLKNQIYNSEESVNVYERSVWQQSQAVSSLHDKISSTREAKQISDITVSIPAQRYHPVKRLDRPGLQMLPIRLLTSYLICPLSSQFSLSASATLSMTDPLTLSTCRATWTKPTGSYKMPKASTKMPLTNSTTCG